MRISETAYPFRAALFFALNPSASLTTSQMVERFGVRREKVTEALKIAVVNGLIEHTPGTPGIYGSGHQEARFAAGEALRRLIAEATTA